MPKLALQRHQLMGQASGLALLVHRRAAQELLHVSQHIPRLLLGSFGGPPSACQLLQRAHSLPASVGAAAQLSLQVEIVGLCGIQQLPARRIGSKC